MIPLDRETAAAPASYLGRRLRSFGHALHGIGHMVATQPHARLHLLAAGLVVAGGWALSIDATDWMVVVLACGLVLAMEAVNTAVEHLCDVVCPTWSEDVRRAKDVAAGAVLIAAIAAAVVGLLVLTKTAG
ncbi:diacylglycerol kinase family protein [Aureimonas jatrophae]|uniref:Diacylglycerol kinase (ATP) n=1 Tax=Aureimonas jatrophae TaxID=1166073 RepID=A0A1H0DJQ5_9HYPH|nr:diacylglycerol kinase family protein [Aureimonas jatrophae]MBB3951929.1 diacylglycerol kinase (ATP) [Aureimonas jatrophae]SDN70289.1 diacylglycerol kinase (ATP) [Aureimonas jatrophae]